MSFDEDNQIAAGLIGEVEIISNIRVRKLKKKRVVSAPAVGTLGLNIQAVPSLGIGVNTVHPTSCIFCEIRRGDIFCEFMGKNLRNISSTEFVKMIRSSQNIPERIFVVEYTAADLNKLWERVPAVEAKPGVPKVIKNNNITKAAIPSKSNEINSRHDESKETNSKIEFSHPISKTQVVSRNELNSNHTDKESQQTSQIDTNTKNVAAFKLKAASPNHESNLIASKVSSKPNATTMSEQEAKIHLSNQTFQKWLIEKKNVWNFEQRVKDNSFKDNDDDKKQEFTCAKPFGLPAGWMVRVQPRSRYTFRCPNGKLFYSKRKAFEYVDGDTVKTSSPSRENPNTNTTDIINRPGDLSVGENKDSIDTSEENLKVAPITKPVERMNQERQEKLVKVKSGTHIIDQEENDSNPKIKELPQPSQGSLSDVINTLTKAREHIDKFGPLPWKGCKIVKGPPAPRFLGLNLQSIPTKLGIGIVGVSEDSPLKGQVKRGDIMTHFMGMPLHGLGIAEFVRLFKLEVKKDRVFQIAPSDFNFDPNTQNENRQQCLDNLLENGNNEKEIEQQQVVKDINEPCPQQKDMGFDSLTKKTINLLKNNLPNNQTEFHQQTVLNKKCYERGKVYLNNKSNSTNRSSKVGIVVNQGNGDIVHKPGNGYNKKVISAMTNKNDQSKTDDVDCTEQLQPQNSMMEVLCPNYDHSSASVGTSEHLESVSMNCEKTTISENKTSHTENSKSMDTSTTLCKTTLAASQITTDANGESLSKKVRNDEDKGLLMSVDESNKGTLLANTTPTDLSILPISTPTTLAPNRTTTDVNNDSLNQKTSNNEGEAFLRSVDESNEGPSFVNTSPAGLSIHPKSAPTISAANQLTTDAKDNSLNKKLCNDEDKSLLMNVDERNKGTSLANTTPAGLLLLPISAPTTLELNQLANNTTGNSHNKETGKDEDKCLLMSVDESNKGLANTIPAGLSIHPKSAPTTLAANQLTTDANDNSLNKKSGDNQNKSLMANVDANNKGTSLTNTTPAGLSLLPKSATKSVNKIVRPDITEASIINKVINPGSLNESCLNKNDFLSKPANIVEQKESNEGLVQKTVEEVSEEADFGSSSKSQPMSMVDSFDQPMRKWTVEEDNLVRRLVKEYGTDDWHRIALEVPKKTATQCRYRWINIIYPAILIEEGNTLPIASSHYQEETLGTDNSYMYKKVIIPPFKGPIGINVQELPSKKGFGVVHLRRTSPLYGKIHRDDVIIKFMDKPLRGVNVSDFTRMVKYQENKNRHFHICTPRTNLASSSHKKQVYNVPEINLDEDEGEDESNNNRVSILTTKGIDLETFNEEDISEMPICFAFNPNDQESERVAATKEKRYNDNFEMRKRQKVH